MREPRRRLSPEEYERAIRPANAIPMQHPTGHIRWVDPAVKDKCLRYGYIECEMVTETVQRAVPKAAIPPTAPSGHAAAPTLGPPKPKEK